MSHDVLLDGTNAAHRTRHLDRRQLIKAGVWAAPVIVLASATPAAAASSTINQPLAVAAYPVSAGSYTPGQITINSAQVWYDYGKWGVAEDAGPTTAAVRWRVVVLSGSTIVKTLIEEHTVVLAKYHNETVSATVTGVPAGTYVVKIEIVSATFSPNPVNGVTFASTGTSSQASVTVA